MYHSQAFKRIYYKDAVETGYFAHLKGEGHCNVNYDVGSSPNSGPLSRVRLLLLIN